MLDTAREPPWMTQARGMLGKAEIPGPQTAPFISTMLQSLGAWWRDDETAWCATFVSACLHDAGLAYPKAFYRARAFETWGRPWVRNAASIAAWGRSIRCHCGPVAASASAGRARCVAGFWQSATAYGGGELQRAAPGRQPGQPRQRDVVPIGPRGGLAVAGRITPPSITDRRQTRWPSCTAVTTPGRTHEAAWTTAHRLGRQCRR
jgi:uncharacterized protein (TIGR02594 family)